MTNTLPKLESHLWRRYNFESEDRYYILILQQDLFHEWSITKAYGGKNNKLGNCIIQSCDSYEDAAKRVDVIKKRRKSHKYVLVSHNNKE